jgi:uncharacterized membrane protein
LESTPDFTQSTTGFAVFPDDSACGGIQAVIKGNVGETANCYDQPSSGVWHHFALIFDKTQSAGNQVALYLDGVLQSPTRSLAASTNTNDFGNNSLWLFSQGGTSGFDSGQLDDLRIYKTALTATEIEQIYDKAVVNKVGAGSSAATPKTVTAAQTSRRAGQRQSIPAGELGGGGITLDLHGVHDNGSLASNQAAVSIGTPKAGDLITCEVTFDGHNSNALASLTDNNNGSYVAAVPAHLNTTLIQWFGIYYKQAVAGAPTTVTLKTTNSQPWSAVSCQAWKGVATSNPLDSAFVQSRDALTTANPTTGANKTPAESGELIVAGLGLYTAPAPAAGTNYSLIDTAPATQWWPEFWVQTSATPTAGNYIRSSDNFTDMMAAFKPASTNSFSIAASPTSLSVVQGHSGTTTISTTISGTFNNPITLSASGVPEGTTASFSVNPIPAPGTGNSVLTLSVGSTTAVGTYPITITGSGGGLQQSTSITLRVTSTGTFTIGASPSALTVIQGSSGVSTISTTVSGGFNNAISLSASGVPSGTSAGFSPNPILAPGAGTSTLTLTVGTTTAPGTYNIVVTGSGGGLQQSTTIALTVTATANFTIAVSPGSLSVIRGNQGTATITTSISNGFNSAIMLSASGLPSGTTVSFGANPIPAPGAGTSTMTIAVGSNTRSGTYSLTITGTGGGLQRSTTVSLTVVAQVTLAWTASVSQVAGYNAYRATQPNGSYTLLNNGLITGTIYLDQTAQSGVTYYYVTTAVNAQGLESVYSNQATATVP